MQPFSFNIKGRLVEFKRPVVMGILNVTPDSFYPDSRAYSEADIAIRALQLKSSGSDIIDVGACSTRPGSTQIDIDREIQRLETALPIIRKAAPDCLISVDTFRSEVARFAIEQFEVDIINDISGGNIDPQMFDVVAEMHVPYVLTHSRSTLDSKDEYTDYECVTRDVLSELGDRFQQLSLMGVTDVIIDPGFGFDKTLDQNYQLLSDLNLFSLFHRPIMVGLSRKSMITRLLEVNADKALNGTTVLNTLALERGTSILRVHDPAEALQAIKIYQKTTSCHHSE